MGWNRTQINFSVMYLDCEFNRLAKDSRLKVFVIVLYSVEWHYPRAMLISIGGELNVPFFPRIITRLPWQLKRLLFRWLNSSLIPCFDNSSENVRQHYYLACLSSSKDKLSFKTSGIEQGTLGFLHTLRLNKRLSFDRTTFFILRWIIVCTTSSTCRRKWVINNRSLFFSSNFLNLVITSLSRTAYISNSREAFISIKVSITRKRKSFTVVRTDQGGFRYSWETHLGCWCVMVISR